MLLMAFYETITMDYCHPTMLLVDDNVSINNLIVTYFTLACFFQLRDSFDEYFKNLKQINSPMRQAARRYLTNDQGGTLAQMRMTPELPLSCKTLSTIVVHATTVILCNREYPILLPFANMLLNPAALLVSYSA